MQQNDILVRGYLHPPPHRRLTVAEAMPLHHHRYCAGCRAAPAISAARAGQDTVMVASFNDSVFWMFGDTVCPRSSRQNNCEDTGMYTVGATSCLPPDPSRVTGDGGGCSATDPPALAYFGAEEAGGFHHPIPMAPIAPLAQNTWIAALTVVDGGAALFSNYYKNPGDGAGPDQAQQGMARWDPAANQFKSGHLPPHTRTPHLRSCSAAWPAHCRLLLGHRHTAGSC